MSATLTLDKERELLADAAKGALPAPKLCGSCLRQFYLWAAFANEIELRRFIHALSEFRDKHQQGFDDVTG